jgi:hypothetical protein
MGSPYVLAIKPILLDYDYVGLGISRIFGNTSPVSFLIPSSADSLS